MKNNLKKIFIIALSLILIPNFSLATSVPKNQTAPVKVKPTTPEVKKQEEVIKEIEKEIVNPNVPVEEKEASVLEFSKNNDASLLESKDSGNLTVVPEKRQFITFVTKEKEVFYLVIDYSGSTRNVKFLREVTNKDMAKLLTNEEIAEINKETEEKETIKSGLETEKNIDNINSKKIEKENSNENNLAKILKDYGHIIIALGIGLLYFVYTKNKKNKNKKSQKQYYDRYENDEDLIE
ncbi:CD1107 family mobile element protein [Peptoniphilaceae bacterium SGI.131]